MSVGNWMDIYSKLFGKSSSHQFPPQGGAARRWTDITASPHITNRGWYKSKHILNSAKVLLPSGMSTHLISQVSSHNYVTLYGCCYNSWYTTLIYVIALRRCGLKDGQSRRMRAEFGKGRGEPQEAQPPWNVWVFICWLSQIVWQWHLREEEFYIRCGVKKKKKRHKTKVDWSVRGRQPASEQSWWTKETKLELRNNPQMSFQVWTKLTGTTNWTCLQ